MPKYEKEYFLREFDWDAVHFRDFDVPAAVTTALQHLGADEPNAAIYTSKLVAHIVNARLLPLQPLARHETNFDQAGELGSWLEYQAKRGIQPFSSFSHGVPDTKIDPLEPAWSSRKWFGNFVIGKVR